MMTGLRVAAACAALLFAAPLGAAAADGAAPAETTPLGRAARTCFTDEFSGDFGERFFAALNSAAPDGTIDALMAEAAGAATESCRSKLGLSFGQTDLLGTYGMGVAVLPVLARGMRAAGLDPAIADAAIGPVVEYVAQDDDSQKKQSGLVSVVRAYANAGVSLKDLRESDTKLLVMYIVLQAHQRSAARKLNF